MASCAQSAEALTPAICGADYFHTLARDCLLCERTGSCAEREITRYARSFVRSRKNVNTFALHSLRRTHHLRGCRVRYSFSRPI